MLRRPQITHLANRSEVKTIAVENFLSTLNGSTFNEAIHNLAADARAYRWNFETQAAIHTGIIWHFMTKEAN